MNQRKSVRHRIMVDIEVAQADAGRCRGYADTVSRDGISIKVYEGQLPSEQRAVLLNFRIWTGRETLFRKMQARIVRVDDNCIGLKFAEHDMVAGSIVHDLLYYKAFERREKPRSSDQAAGSASTKDRVNLAIS